MLLPFQGNLLHVPRGQSQLQKRELRDPEGRIQVVKQELRDPEGRNREAGERMCELLYQDIQGHDPETSARRRLGDCFHGIMRLQGAEEAAQVG